MRTVSTGVLKSHPFQNPIELYTKLTFSVDLTWRSSLTSKDGLIKRKSEIKAQNVLYNYRRGQQRLDC